VRARAGATVKAVTATARSPKARVFTVQLLPANATRASFHGAGAASRALGPVVGGKVARIQSVPT
jgi:hypothetical protein